MDGRKVWWAAGGRSLAVFFMVVLFASCGPSTAVNGIFGGSSPVIALGSTEDLYRFFTFHEQRYPLVSAHRGGPTSGYPENALETFAFQHRYQPLIIECDIRMTRDSVLILMHDETLERTTDGSGRVSDRTYEQLRSLRLRDPDGALTDYRIPTLDEALQWGANKVIYTLDVKRGVPYQQVVQAIQRNRAESYSVVITYNADQVLEVHRLDPSLMISASIRSAADLLRLNDRSIPDNRLLAFVGTSEVDPDVYDLLHGHGIMCILGTMGNLDRQAERIGNSHYVTLIERGADILSTDRPREAGESLERYRKKMRLTSSFVK